MKAGPVFWIVVVGLALLHFVLHVGFGLGSIAPDLATVALLLAAREMGMGGAAGVGFGLGLLEDALSVLSFGANGVAMFARPSGCKFCIKRQNAHVFG